MTRCLDGARTNPDVYDVAAMCASRAVEPPPLDHRNARVGRRVLLIVLVTVFLDAVGFGIVIPLLPLYAMSMDTSELTAGVILASYSAAQALSTPALGSLSDRYGRRPIILLSLAGGAASMALFAIAASANAVWLLIVARMCAGATAGNLAACQAAIADITDESRRAGAMGTLGVGLGLGLMVGPALGGALIDHFGPMAPPIGACVLLAMDFLLAVFLATETRPPSEMRSIPGPRPQIRTVLAERRMAIVLAITFAAYVTQTSMQTAFPLLVVERLGWRPGQIGYMFAGFGFLLFLVQGLLVGRVSRRTGELPLLVWGVLLEIAGMLCIAFGPGSLEVMLGGLLVGVGIGITNPVLAALASKLASPEQQGAVLGIAQSMGSVARTFGPVCSGLLYQLLGAPAPFVGGAIAMAVGCVLALDLRRRMGVAATRAATASAA